MAEAVARSHLVTGTRREKIRLRPAIRDGKPVIRLDLLEPVASHSDALVLIGRPVFIPPGQVEAFCAAMARLADDAPEPAAPEDEF